MSAALTPARGEMLRAFFLALMHVGRLTKILSSLIRIITLKEENQSEKSDARLQPYTGRAEITLVGRSPLLIVKRISDRKRRV